MLSNTYDILAFKIVLNLLSLYLGQEYARADFRWGFSDPTVVSLEVLTVLGSGPLCVLRWSVCVRDSTLSRHGKDSAGFDESGGGGYDGCGVAAGEAAALCAVFWWRPLEAVFVLRSRCCRCPAAGVECGEGRAANRRVGPRLRAALLRAAFMVVIEA